MSGSARIRPRGDTAANWTAGNPILALREMALELDTGKWKVGDGTTAWNALGYFGAALAHTVTFNTSGGAAAGTSFNGSVDRIIDYSTVGAAKTGAVTGSGLTQTSARLLGRTTAATGAIEELTAAAAKTFLAISSSDVSGLAAIATSGSASDLSAGTLPAGRFPALTGDVTTAAGALATTIPTSVISTFMRTVTDDADAATARTTLGITGGFTAIAADRTALSNLSTAHAGVFLKESGREGTFVWSSSNLSAKVTADTGQGIHVAPASDTTGASGAWVRQITGPYNPCWFGIASGNSSAVNESAWAAMRETLKARATASGSYRTLGHVRFPDELTYNLGNVDLKDGSIRISGFGVPTPTTGTTIMVAAGKEAFRTQRPDTSGTTGTTGTGVGADGSIIEYLRIVGGYTTTEGEFHAIRNRAHNCIFRYNVIQGFEGDGIHIIADAGTVEGNANCFEVYGNIISGCRNGIFADGNNSNAGSGRNNDVSNNRQWGLWDSSFLGNTWHGIAENCGRTAGSYTPSMVSYSSKRYAVVAGQEAGASTNAPSGTTADNTWWYYVEAGAPDTTTYNIPAWVSGTTYRAGGPIRTDNNNGGTVILGFYTEIGQGPSQLVWPTLVLGGDHLAGIKGVTRLAHDDSGLLAQGTFSAGWDAVNGASFVTYKDTFLVRGGKQIQLQDAYAPTSNFYIKNSGSNLVLYSDQNVGIYFGVNGAYQANVQSDGFHVTGVVAASGAVTGSNLSGTNTGDQTITLTGDVTGTGTGSFATTIGANKVLDTMLRTSVALSVIGRSANSTGNVADISGANNQVLRVSGSVLGFGAVDLATAQVTGDLPFANLTQGSALSVLGVTGNSTADVASIAAASDGQVLRRSGTAVAFGAVDLASANSITGDLPYANLVPPGAASKLLGRGTTTGDWQECSIDATLAYATTTLGVAKVPNAVTFDTAGGAAAASTFDGSAARTVDYSTVGAVGAMIAKYCLVTNFANTSPTSTVLTATANGITAVDGNNLVANDTVLLVGQTLPAENGLYTVTTAGTASVKTVLTRSARVDTWTEVSNYPEITITNGTQWIGSSWELFGATGGTLGTTAIVCTCLAQQQKGSTQSQATSKSTGVTLNIQQGAITFNAAALAATTTVSFTLTNSFISTADDEVRVWLKSGLATSGTYQVWVSSVAAGSCVISLRNMSAGSLSEAVVIGFKVERGVKA